MQEPTFSMHMSAPTNVAMAIGAAPLPKIIEKPFAAVTQNEPIILFNLTFCILSYMFASLLGNIESDRQTHVSTHKLIMRYYVFA